MAPAWPRRCGAAGADGLAGAFVDRAGAVAMHLALHPGQRGGRGGDLLLLEGLPLAIELGSRRGTWLLELLMLVQRLFNSLDALVTRCPRHARAGSGPAGATASSRKCGRWTRPSGSCWEVMCGFRGRLDHPGRSPERALDGLPARQLSQALARQGRHISTPPSSARIADAETVRKFVAER